MEYRELLRNLDNNDNVLQFMDGKQNPRDELAEAAVNARREKVSQIYSIS